MHFERITITTIDSPSPVPSIEGTQQSQQAVIDFETPHTLTSKTKRKDKSKSKSPKSSSPTTPTSLKKFWFPKFGAQSTLSKSMLTLGATDQLVDKENERCHSSLSLSNSISSPTPNKLKKIKWLMKLFPPASAQKLSAESDSSNGGAEKTTKKKTTFLHKRLQRRSKTREPIADC